MFRLVSVLVGRFSLSEALIALSWVVIRPSLVGRSGWLSMPSEALVARCLVLGWLSIRVALLVSLRLLWISLGRLVGSWLVGSPCGSYSSFHACRVCVVAGSPEVSLQSVVTLLHPQKKVYIRNFSEGSNFARRGKHFTRNKKLNPKLSEEAVKKNDLGSEFS